MTEDIEYILQQTYDLIGREKAIFVAGSFLSTLQNDLLVLLVIPGKRCEIEFGAKLNKDTRAIEYCSIDDDLSPIEDLRLFIANETVPL